MTSATLINVFQVPADREAEFLALWERANEMLRSASGYTSTRLHRAVRPDARYRYINVAQIESVENWRTVVGGPDFVALSAEMADFQPAPALYEVVREHILSPEHGSRVERERLR